ncbi:MAG: hypothetical protein JWL82_554 [Parcubacteria group bacterium]|nr:hypothetical protein [Parcubacteria group bacterium]
MRSKAKKRQSRGASLAMPDRTITMLSFLAAGIFFVYLVLVIITVSYATMQTSLAAEARTTEGAIAQLETTYYSAISKGSASTPSSAGLVAPVVVEYAVAKAPGLSFAGR